MNCPICVGLGCGECCNTGLGAPPRKIDAAIAALEAEGVRVAPSDGAFILSLPDGSPDIRLSEAEVIWTLDQGEDICAE